MLLRAGILSGQRSARPLEPHEYAPDHPGFRPLVEDDADTSADYAMTDLTTTDFTRTEDGPADGNTESTTEAVMTAATGTTTHATEDVAAAGPMTTAHAAARHAIADYGEGQYASAGYSMSTSNAPGSDHAPYHSSWAPRVRYATRTSEASEDPISSVDLIHSMLLQSFSHGWVENPGIAKIRASRSPLTSSTQ
ncbi:hypothetical protein VTK56DRAFT_3801 [Thermocarpiscus australiensis]